MSGDGAHMGVDAERALGTILGGEPQPTEEERRSPDEMRAWILSAPTRAEFEARGPEIDYSYGERARVVARVILEQYLADPRLATLPMETEYDWDADPDRGAQGMKPEFVRQRSLSDVLRENGVYDEHIAGLGITGFQWGWAVNAARFCVEIEPQPNPAILG